MALLYIFAHKEVVCIPYTTTDAQSSLTEEIQEKSKEGEILLAMDANAKIGLLNEAVSRNGKLLLDVLKQHNLTVLNSTVL